jgi:hypothetical protein
MAYGNGANGAAHEMPPAMPIPVIAVGEQNQVAAMSPERFERIRERLMEPFDPTEIKWRVAATSTRQGKHGSQKRGQMVAYADQRAYTDRLNEVFGEWGWTRTYDIQVAQNFERRTPGEKSQTTVSAKVVVVSKVTIHGLGSHTGVGEEWAHDENAATRAEAQAFKRACACFGLGRYLYDLGTVWVDLDSYNRPVQTPVLPDWAMPHQAKRPRNQPSPKGLARDAMLSKVRELRQKVGAGLSRFVIEKYAGTEPEECDEQKLPKLIQKLTDIGNGIDRLRRAASAVGSVRYSEICSELNLVSDSIDDIPTREALQVLLSRVEQSGQRNESIGNARGRLLQAAREIAEKTGKRLADIIAEVSEGKLSLDGLRDLTDADVPLVSTVTSRILGGGNP